MTRGYKEFNWTRISGEVYSTATSKRRG